MFLMRFASIHPSLKKYENVNKKRSPACAVHRQQRAGKSTVRSQNPTTFKACHMFPCVN